ncbi:hypothetical protein INR49_012470 [Caranx melampygus]|nr:hypothetical protein INR49_012470 [Caranx melampygus]
MYSSYSHRERGFHIRAALSLLFNRNPLPFPCALDRGGPRLQKKPPESRAPSSASGNRPPPSAAPRTLPPPRRCSPAQPVAHDAGSADGGARRRALPIGATSPR